MLVLIQTFADVGEELQRELFAFLIDFCEVDDLRALGFRHLLLWVGGSLEVGGVGEGRGEFLSH